MAGKEKRCGRFAIVWRALNSNNSTMLIHDPASNGEAKARAVHRTRTISAEMVEYARKLVSGDSYTCIVDHYANALAFQLCTDHHVASARRIFNGVVQQNQQDLRKSVGIPIYPDLFRGVLQPNSHAIGEEACLSNCGSKHWSKIHGA